MATFYQLARDPVMLLSFVNTQLRDKYHSFDDFIKATQADREAVTSTLSSIDYVYDSDLNQFV